jgi:hypothetical protein
MARTRVAVLDDYQGFAKEPFSKLDSSKYDVTHIKDTLLPYGHPNTPQAAKDELVQRLKPYEIISRISIAFKFQDRLANEWTKVQ